MKYPRNLGAPSPMMIATITNATVTSSRVNPWGAREGLSFARDLAFLFIYLSRYLSRPRPRQSPKSEEGFTTVQPSSAAQPTGQRPGRAPGARHRSWQLPPGQDAKKGSPPD